MWTTYQAFAGTLALPSGPLFIAVTLMMSNLAPP
jgi:hypothetical protein